MEYYTNREMEDMVRLIEKKYGWIIEYRFDYEEQNYPNTLYHYDVYVTGDYKTFYVDLSVEAFEMMGAYSVYADYIDIDSGVAHLQVTLT